MRELRWGCQAPRRGREGASLSSESRRHPRSCALGPVLAALIWCPPSGAAANEPGRFETILRPADARATDEFLDSLGINTYFTFPDTAYATRFEEVCGKLLALGLHHVRDWPNSFVPELGRSGMTTTLNTQPTVGRPRSLQAKVKDLHVTATVVDAVEGPNDPDTFWGRQNVVFRGSGYPEGAAAWQRELFRALKSDPATATLTVIGPALGLAGAADRLPPPSWSDLAAAVDWGNFHPYPFGGNAFGPALVYGGLNSFFREGTFPSLDQSPDALTVYRAIYRSRSFAATVSGYPTGPYFSSDAQQARYFPRLYAEFFRLGIRSTYVYQLLDDVEDPSGRNAEASFGLLRHDLSERPSFRRVAELAAPLARPRGTAGSIAEGERLMLAVSGQGEFWDARRVYHLLLKRAKDTLLLLLWNEVSGEDVSTTSRRTLSVPPLPASLRADVVLQYAVDGRAPVRAPEVWFDVPDQLLAIEIASP